MYFKQQLEVNKIYLYYQRQIHKSKTIEEICESNNIWVNMQSPEDLKERPIVGCPNCSTQGTSGVLEKY